MTIEITDIKEEYIEDLARIESESFSMPWTAEAFRELLSIDYCTYLVALVDGVVAGSAGFRQIGTEADIDNVVTAPGFRGMGVGTKLMEAVISRGESQGVTEYTLEVRESNRVARKLYEKFGFVCEGIRPNFYEKPRENAAIYWRH